MALDPKLRINLERVTVLIIDGNAQGVDILRQLFSGFGVRTLLKASSGEEAKHIVSDREINLVVCNDVLPDMAGYDFVRWLRRSKIEPNAFTPVILTSGHTKRSMVSEARDTGANFVIAKPISTKVLLERVVFVARESRPFLEAGEYTGPDRRFHEMGPPETGGRRRDDAPPGTAASPGETGGENPDLKRAGA
jgi:DNA-binding response OmpR family regulator